MEFDKEEDDISVEEGPAQETSYKIINIILTPKGKCPVKLLGKTEKEVKTWLRKVAKYNFGSDHHTIQSIKFWVKGFYPIFSEDYYNVRKLVSAHAESFGFINIEKRRLEYQREKLAENNRCE